MFDIDDMVQCINTDNPENNPDVAKLVMNGVYFVYDVAACGGLKISADGSLLKSSRFRLAQNIAWPID